MRYTTQQGWRPQHTHDLINKLSLDIKANPGVKVMEVPMSVAGEVGQFAVVNTAPGEDPHFYLDGVMVLLK